jgi:hypothetical protein
LARGRRERRRREARDHADAAAGVVRRDPHLPGANERQVDLAEVAPNWAEAC